MDTKVRLVEWLQTLDYDGDIPEHLENFCNPSTYVVWEQLISKVKPRAEVKKIKTNLMVKRLQENQLKDQEKYFFPLREIEIYKKRNELEANSNCLENELNANDAHLQQLAMKNKIAYVEIEHLKERVMEKEEKTWIYCKKSKLLEGEIKQVEEKIANLKSTTPEEDENPNTEEIMDTLQKCASKLQKLSEIVSQNNNTKQRSNFSSMQVNPENGHLSALFTPSCKKENVKKKIPITVIAPHRLPKRESLGLLPDSCLDDCASDIFLSGNESGIFVSKYANEPQQMSAVLENSLHHGQHTQQAHNGFSIDTLIQHEPVCKILQQLVCRKSRGSIIKCCEEIHEALISNLRTICSQYDNSDNSGNQEMIQSDLSKLYYLHIKNELERIPHLKQIKELRAKAQESTKQLKFILSEDEINNLVSQIEVLNLNTAIDFWKKEGINNSVNNNTVINELQMTSDKIDRTKSEIANEINKFEGFMSSALEVLESVGNDSEETLSCLTKLNNFLEDLTWAETLKDGLSSKEIRVFQQFPFAYNKKVARKGFKRDGFSNKIPVSIDLDSNSVQMLTMLMDVPWRPAEGILCNLLKMKRKLKTLKMVQDKDKDILPIKPPKIQKEDILTTDKHIDDLIENIKRRLNSTQVVSNLHCAMWMKKVCNFWTFMKSLDVTK